MAAEDIEGKNVDKTHSSRGQYNENDCGFDRSKESRLAGIDLNVLRYRNRNKTKCLYDALNVRASRSRPEHILIR